MQPSLVAWGFSCLVPRDSLSKDSSRLEATEVNPPPNQQMVGRGTPRCVGSQSARSGHPPGSVAGVYRRVKRAPVRVVPSSPYGRVRQSRERRAQASTTVWSWLLPLSLCTTRFEEGYPCLAVCGDLSVFLRCQVILRDNKHLSEVILGVAELKFACPSNRIV